MRAKAGPMALVVAVVVAVVGLVVGRTVLRDDPACAALSQPVVGLDGYDWGNGFTSSGAEWISVLTQGTTEADAPSRRAIATAVAADRAGYRQFRAALPDGLEAAADRQRAIAVDPGSDRTALGVEDDVAALDRYGTTACHLV